MSAIVCIVAVLTAGTASAHSALASSDPADGTEIATAPPRVNLTFNEPIQSAFANLTVTGPDGQRWERSQPHVDGTVVSVDLDGLGPVGQYTVGFRVVSADGHPVSGSYTFTLTQPGNLPNPTTAVAPQSLAAPTTATPSATQEDNDNGFPLWIPAALIVAVAAALLTLLLRSKNGRKRP
nr:copper resistance CopC family protein [Nocardia amamiensis]